MLSKAFYIKLNRMCEELGMNPRDLLLVMFLESGLNPHAKNPHGGAYGLIQFMPSTLKGMGVQDTSNFKQLSAEQQLDYVKRFIKNNESLNGGKPFTSATQYYVANFFPASLKRWRGDDPIANKNVVVASGNSSWAQERAAYSANKGLDFDHDGKITVGDLTKLLTSLEKNPNFQSNLQRLNSVAGEGSISELSSKRLLQHSNRSEHGLLTNFIAKIESLLDKFADNNQSIKMKKFAHQYNQSLIYIDANTDFASKIEFAKILACVLNEELSAQTSIHTNKSHVEIQCITSSSIHDVNNIIDAICAATSNVFKYATKKIGGLNIHTMIERNAYSKYLEVTEDMYTINNRKFRLKFAKVK